jgi:hypothetical protein
VRRDRREKRAERVALGRNFMISLGIPFESGALHLPSELTVISNVSRVIMSARVREGSPRGVTTKGLDLVGCPTPYGGMGSSGGVAWVSSLSKFEWTAAITSQRESTMVVSARLTYVHSRWRC